MKRALVVAIVAPLLVSDSLSAGQVAALWLFSFALTVGGRMMAPAALNAVGPNSVKAMIFDES